MFKPRIPAVNELAEDRFFSHSIDSGIWIMPATRAKTNDVLTKSRPAGTDFCCCGCNACAAFIVNVIFFKFLTFTLHWLWIISKLAQYRQTDKSLETVYNRLSYEVQSSSVSSATIIIHYEWKIECIIVIFRSLPSFSSEIVASLLLNVQLLCADFFFDRQRRRI